MARVIPRLTLGTAGSSDSPEAEDAVAMAAFTTRSHELISAFREHGKTLVSSRSLCRGSRPADSVEVEEAAENDLTISSHWRKGPLKTGNMFWCGLRGHPGATLWAV